MQAYLTKPEFAEILLKELKAQSITSLEYPHPEDLTPGRSAEFFGEALPFFITQEKIPAAFCIDIWPDITKISFGSISEAAEILKKSGKLWFHHPVSHIRRGALIQEKIFEKFKSKLKKFPQYLPLKFPPEPLPQFGCFSLLSPNDLVFCTNPTSPIPTGIYEFIEDKINPPNRAYLKLWEAFSHLQKYPKPGEVCVDLGASPGGWTWVLQSFGAKVIAVDKAPLDIHIGKLPNVSLLQQSAFALDFSNHSEINSQIKSDIKSDIKSEIDWLVCDIACYPDKLLSQLKLWIGSHKIKNIISTIKLQGEIDLDLLNLFKQIPGIYIKHLWHNKHELTLFWSKN